MAETDGKANRTTDSILNHMKSDEKNQHERQKVEELLPNRRVNNIELVVLRIYPRRLISTKNYTGAVAAACGRDETGIVGLVLWDSQIEQIRVGDIIRIEGGWCRQRDGELVVSTGKSGKIQILDR